MFRTIASLLLILACSTVSAREAAKHSANGEGGTCDDMVMTAPDPVPASTKSAATKTTPASSPTRPVSQRSGDDSIDESIHTPRWHSFLPGMFR